MSTPGPAPPWKCPFTEDIGYLVFSSTVSFYGPLAVMVFTYIRIYQVDCCINLLRHYAKQELTHSK